MKIRGKLLIAIFSIISSFFMVFIFFIILGSRILSLKDLENKASIAVGNMYKLTSSTSSLLNSNDSLDVLRLNWDRAVTDFELAFFDLVQSNEIKNLNKDIQDIQESTKNIWMINRSEFNKTSDLIASISLKKKDVLSEKSILRFFWEAENNDDLIKDYYLLLPLKFQLDSVQNKSIDFLWVLEDLSRSINSIVKDYISIILVISLIVVIIIVFSAILFGTFFSNRLAEKIIKVEASLFAISKGDFTKKLDIEGRDEFGKLSDSFNRLMSDLWAKIDSVMEFMKKVGSSMKTDINIELSLNTIITAIVESLDADSGANTVKIDYAIRRA